MSAPPPEARPPGIIARTWRLLASPSARWPVLALVGAGIALGFAATAGTQVMVAATGTDEFCGGACHSMQWVAAEHKLSVHADNRTGVRAGCHDCHIPHAYPEILVYKTRAGIKDTVNELRGILSTEEKFKKERLRMAQLVWAEYKANDSRACRGCHVFTAAVVKKQKEFAQSMHQQVLESKATCIDCHKGVAHTAPEE